MEHRNFEQGGGLPNIQFETLEVGDIIMFDTESGSSYKLSVQENEDEARVSVERTNDAHAVVGDDQTSWESIDEGIIFELRGSCLSMLTGPDGGLAAVNSREGVFTVGQRAWLGTDIDGVDRTLITSKIESLNLIPAA